MKNYSIGKIFPTQCPGVTECADGTWTDRPANAPRLCMRHGGPRFPIPKPEKVKAPRPLRPKAAAPVVVPSAPIVPPAPPTLFDAPTLEAPPSVVPQTMAKNDPLLSEIRSEDIEKIEGQYHATQTVKKLIRESFDSGLLKNYTVTSSKRIRLEFQQPKNGVVEVLVSQMETDANNFVNPKKRRYQKVFVYLKKKPEPAPVVEAPPSVVPQTSKRLEILKASLDKKKADFSQRWSAHRKEVAGRQGQPFHMYKKGEADTRKRFGKEMDILSDLNKSIEKTERAIEKEAQKIKATEEQKALFPPPILEFIERGDVIQWRKYPRIMFVPGVDKARIVYDNDKTALTVAFFRTLQATGDTAAIEKFKAVAKAMDAALKAWIIENPLPKKERSKPQTLRTPAPNEPLTFENINSRLIDKIEIELDEVGYGRADIEDFIKSYINKKRPTFEAPDGGRESSHFNQLIHFTQPQNGVIIFTRKKGGEDIVKAKIYLKRK